MNENRESCYREMNRICVRESGLSLSDLPDLPCITNALDLMEELIEQEGEMTSLTEIRNIAQEAVFELLEEEGFPIC